ERKSKIIENIQNTIAIYQGQATLGKIVTVLLHEGRKPVQYIRQQAPNLSRWLEHYKAKDQWEDEMDTDILVRLKTFRQQQEFRADLFRILDSLAKQNRGSKEEFSLRNALMKSLRIFEGDLQAQGIIYHIECSSGIQIVGFEEDIIIAVT